MALYEILFEIQKKTGAESVSKFVRSILLREVEKFGFDISNIENYDRGVRRDIKRKDPEALEKVRGYAANARQFIKNPGRPRKGTSAPKEIFDELQKKSKA